MMKYIHNWKNAIAGRLALVALLLMGGISAQADTKVFIDDFSIAPGETKEVAVQLNTNENIKILSLNISLPEGIDFVTKSGNANRIALTVNRDRAKGFSLEGNPQNGNIILNAMPGSAPAIQGTEGTIFTFKVTADNDAEDGYITINGVEAVDTDGESVDVDVEDAEVTVDKDVEPGDVVLFFSQKNLTVAPGQTVTVDVIMKNPEVLVQGFQADLYVPDGWTYSIIESNRMDNGGSGNRILSYNEIDGEDGVIFSISLTAPASFSGSDIVSITNAKATVNNKTKVLDDITLSVTSDGSITPTPGTFALNFAQAFAAAAPGETVSLGVNLNNYGLDVQGFQANIVVPEGWSYSIIDSNRMENGGQADRVLAYNGIEGESGVIFTIALTAPADFTTGSATVEVVNATATVDSKRNELDDISLTIKAKNPADLATVNGWIDGLQEKLDATVAKIEKEYPEAAEDQSIIRGEQNIQQGINDLHSDVDAAYAKGELNPNDFADEVKELSDAIDALEYNAKEIQENAGNKENEAGKAALDDEIAELQKKLDDAVASQPKDLPKAATKEISDAADAIQKDIDALKAQVEKDYEDGKLTADSKLDPAKKQAILDAIDALKAQIAKWLRGDVDNDGDVDMADFYALKKLISEEKTPKADEDANAFYRCDANADGEINVGDLQGILNICIGLNANGK